MHELSVSLDALHMVLIGAVLILLIVVIALTRSAAKQRHELKTEFSKEQSRWQELESDYRHQSQRLEQVVESKDEDLVKIQTTLDSAQKDLDTQRSFASQMKSDLAADSARLEQVLEQYASLESSFANEKREKAALQDQLLALTEKHSALQTLVDEKKNQIDSLNQSFDQQKVLLEQSFQNLANKIFDEKGKAFSETSKGSIESMLQPFREQITEFRKRVDSIHKDNNEASGRLQTELEQLKQLNQAMTSDAQNLTRALKGDKKKLGIWGEVQLEQTLQLAGLVKGDHYQAQASFTDEAGKRNLPDFVIHLPDAKHLIIDSKVSLVDYDQAISAENEDQLAVAMAGHVKAVKNHIDDLASKSYTNLIGIKSPSFVLMFMPIEPAYIEAMKFDASLFNYGYQKGVVLVSHTTLMPILRTVANLWMIEKSHSEVKEVSNRAGDLYNQVCLVAERMKSLGQSLQQASKHYNGAVTAVVGQQGLVGKVERFKTLSNKVSKTMPAIETQHLDVDVDRLEAVALPEIEETDSEE